MDGGGVAVAMSQPPPVRMPTMQRFPAPRPPMGGGFMPRGQMGAPGGYQPRMRGDNMMMANSFDGKRMRNKAALRRTIDYNASMINYLENRIWQRDYRDRHALQTDPIYSCQMVPSLSLLDSPVNCVATRHIRTSTNKIRCPVFCVCWTPEGRRLVTGASSGEFTLWNGLTFNFETILQAHDTSVRVMKWSHNDQWMLTADHAGFVKYWQSNMNNVKMYQAHKDPIRGLSFCPTDQKFASCSDDGTVRIWDFLSCTEEKILRGHGADVKCVEWHPQKSLVASGSKDTQQPLKLWDPRMGESLATVHAHKHTVMELSFNKNGNWLLTASRDHLLKLFDVRNLKEELQSFRGHKKEATTVAWHPIHEQLFASGGSDGSIMYWMVGSDKEVGNIDEAHDNMVWSLAWHPLGHILVSGSNDHTTKFWARNKPGDQMRDRYNLNLLPQGITEDMLDMDADLAATLPGMGLEYGLPEHLKKEEPKDTVPSGIGSSDSSAIPGLDFESTPMSSSREPDRSTRKKVPYAKPVPKDFQQAWAEGKQPLSIQASPSSNSGNRNPRENGATPTPDQQKQQQQPPGPPPSQPDSVSIPSPFNNQSNNNMESKAMPPQDQDMRQMGQPPPFMDRGRGGYHNNSGRPPMDHGPPPNKRMREDDGPYMGPDRRPPWEREQGDMGRGRGGFYRGGGRGGYMGDQMESGGNRTWQNEDYRGLPQRGRGGSYMGHDGGPPMQDGPPRGHYEDGPPPYQMGRGRGGYRGGPRGGPPGGNYSWRARGGMRGR